MLDELNKVADLVSKLGFPIFVALYLLMRLDSILVGMIKQNAELLGLLRDVRTAMLMWGTTHDRPKD